MGAGEAQAEYPPDSLLAAGWHQGTLFWLPGASVAWNVVETGPASASMRLQSDRVKDKEPLVLISQDCDILSDKELRVEALKCRIKDKNKPSDASYLARLADSASYREFVLDPGRGYVADARARLLIDKAALRSVVPDPWKMADGTRQDFVDWLAGRYDRPPVPTSVHEALCRPVREEIERLRRDEPERFAALNRTVRKIRVRLPPPVSTALDLGLLIILEDDIDADGAAAVDTLVEKINRLGQDGAICKLEIEQVPYGEVLLSEFEATRPLDLDYMTDHGDEISLSSLGMFDR